MGITFKQTPEMFGLLHIAILILIAVISVFFFMLFWQEPIIRHVHTKTRIQNLFFITFLK